jgi:hypothetical protein
MPVLMCSRPLPARATSVNWSTVCSLDLVCCFHWTHCILFFLSAVRHNMWYRREHQALCGENRRNPSEKRISLTASRGQVRAYFFAQRAYTHARAHTHTHTPTHTHIYTFTHAHTRARTHTHTHKIVFCGVNNPESPNTPNNPNNPNKPNNPNNPNNPVVAQEKTTKSSDISEVKKKEEPRERIKNTKEATQRNLNRPGKTQDNEK